MSCKHWHAYNGVMAISLDKIGVDVIKFVIQNNLMRLISNNTHITPITMYVFVYYLLILYGNGNNVSNII